MSAAPQQQSRRREHHQRARLRHLVVADDLEVAPTADVQEFDGGRGVGGGLDFDLVAGVERRRAPVQVDTVLQDARLHVVSTAVDLYAVLLINAVQAQYGVAITPYQSATGTTVLSPADFPTLLGNRIDAAPATAGVQELKKSLPNVTVQR